MRYSVAVSIAIEPSLPRATCIRHRRDPLLLRYDGDHVHLDELAVEPARSGRDRGHDVWGTRIAATVHAIAEQHAIRIGREDPKRRATFDGDRLGVVDDRDPARPAAGVGVQVVSPTRRRDRKPIDVSYAARRLAADVEVMAGSGA